MPSSALSSSSAGEPGGGAPWPESEPQLPASSHRSFSHRMPVYAAGHTQRTLLWHVPPFWQCRSSLSQTFAAERGGGVGVGRGEEKQNQFQFIEYIMFSA